MAAWAQMDADIARSIMPEEYRDQSVRFAPTLKRFVRKARAACSVAVIYENRHM